MFGFDYPLNLAQVWDDVAFGCMTAAVQCTTAMLGLGPTAWSPAGPVRTAQPFSPRTDVSRRTSPQPGASWYRAPDSSPFEVTSIAMAWASPFAAPWMAMAPLQPMLGIMQPFQAWTGMLGWPLAAAFAMPANGAGWPMPVWPWKHFAAALAPASSAPASATPFAAYRSDSGHAVAQITFPNKVVAAVAVPSGAAPLLDQFFAWPLMMR